MRSKVIKLVMATGVVVVTLFLAALLTTAVTGTENRAPEVPGTAAVPTVPDGQNLIRFHVIANSDTDRDQALKRKIRDLIVEGISPKLSKAKTIEEARIIAKANMGEMKKIAQREIAAWGEDYPVAVQLGRFDFPVKSYGDLTLPAGNYEAVRVVIGKGQGANWWCVLFPPLCFVDVSRAMNTAPGIPDPAPRSLTLPEEGTGVVADEAYKNAEPNIDSLRRKADLSPEKEAVSVTPAVEMRNAEDYKMSQNVNVTNEDKIKVRFKILEFFDWVF